LSDGDENVRDGVAAEDEVEVVVVVSCAEAGADLERLDGGRDLFGGFDGASRSCEPATMNVGTVIDASPSR
jgi:hypothetical protein